MWIVCCFLMFLARPGIADSTRPLRPLPIEAAGSRASQPADPNRFSFIVAGDNRSAGRGIPPPPTAERIFTEIHLLHPAFVLWTGDTIYGSEEPVAEARTEYDSFLNQAAQAAAPIYNAPGNHEIYDRPEMADLYISRMGPLYGSFDYGNTHIIALDTEEIGSHGGIGTEQMAWLRQDLAVHKQAAHLIAFMHHPLFPKDAKEGFASSDNRDALHRLFVENNVRNVFSGHEHLFYKSEHDGVTYWVSGGGGAPTDAPVDEGGFQHYLRVEVDGANLTVTVLQPWRLFATVEQNATDGSAAGLLSNYNACDLPMYLEFPANAVPSGSSVAAAWTYKGKTHPLDATIVPSSGANSVTVRVVVPKNRAARVTIAPRASRKETRTSRRTGQVCRQRFVSAARRAKGGRYRSVGCPKEAA